MNLSNKASVIQFPFNLFIQSWNFLMTKFRMQNAIVPIQYSERGFLRNDFNTFGSTTLKSSPFINVRPCLLSHTVGPIPSYSVLTGSLTWPPTCVPCVYTHCTRPEK